MKLFDFTGNRVFDDRFSAFAPQGQQGKPGSGMFSHEFLETGVKVKENGDVDFGYFAPNANNVSVVFGIKSGEPLAMTKDGDGVWKVTLPYDPSFCGPKAFHFDVDGAAVLSQYCPIYYSHSKIIHYVDIPDANTPYILMRDVPHGAVSAELYWSASVEDWQRCLVYTPSAYSEGGDYPVLYLQHGGGENETSWVYNGRASHIMDNLISDGKCVPFIVVMCDGGVRAKGEHSFGGVSGFESTLLESCIPFIEKRYRVKTGKQNRAIAGFSMGSMQSSIIGLSHTDTFAYIGLLSGFLRRIGRDFDYDSGFDINPHLDIMRDKDRFMQNVKLLYRAIGSKDVHYAAFEADDRLCAEHGFDQYPNVVRSVFEGYPHDWAVLRRQFNEFAQMLFR